MLGFALTVFGGAFLLFAVQPMIGKYTLPWFGGGPGVWTTCMLFFQTLLLGGYAYAHLVARRLKPRAQVLVQAGLVLAALLLLPITPAASWKPQSPDHPTLRILALLAASLGAPYFVLSTTGPLLQHWWSRCRPGASPYRLYALSNAGSLLALLSFPFCFEPHFTRKRQTELWGWGLAAYAACFVWPALKMWRSASAPAPEQVAPGKPGVTPPPSSSCFQASMVQPPSPSREALAAPPGGKFAQSALWLLLPACSSVLLLATTNKLCQDVAVIPFLWIVPLALYLLSFIICFDSPRWYVRPLFALGLIAAAAGICRALLQGTELSLYWQIGLYCAGLFLCCMACHGELYRLRPAPEQLTGYYLLIAAGGAFGGLFVAVLAPLIFRDFYELHWGLFGCVVLFALSLNLSPGPSWRWLACALTLAGVVGIDQGVAWAAPHFKTFPRGAVIALRASVSTLLVLAALVWVARGKFRSFARWRLVACGWLVAGIVVLGVCLWKQGAKPAGDVVFRARNFYGTLTVYEEYKADPQQHYFLLEHGRITHGLQFVDSTQALWPTTYYGEESGVGLAMNALSSRPRRVGLVGLGTGTLTAYLRKGDYGRIYEINPQVARVAASQFTYLSNCPARIDIALGDARLSLEKEAPEQFDLLVLDAFSSDAIPVHLLTAESFALYQRHLKPEGIIAVHISNHYVDLEPVVVNLARHFGYQLALIDYDEDEASWWLYASTWVLLTRNDAVLDTPAIHQATGKIKTMNPKVPLWTDDFASLYQILR
jgi:hypothetical protein